MGVLALAVAAGLFDAGANALSPRLSTDFSILLGLMRPTLSLGQGVPRGTLSLVLPAALYITGVGLPVDGGLTIRNARHNESIPFFILRALAVISVVPDALRRCHRQHPVCVRPA